MAASVQLGELIAGRYRVEKILGVGAMGTVVSAWDTREDARRAVKVMHPEPMGDASWAERLRREAQIGRELTSEHAVRVLDVGGFDPEERPYLVMELLEGTDLGRVLKARGPLPIADAALFVYQACEAIAEAHAIGVVHRDLKPGNLFLTQRPNGSEIVKVLDFGISKAAIEGADITPDVTKTGELLGSPAYMAPEQIRASSNADPRSDVWALGVILYELLTGRWPFPAKASLEIIAMVLERAPEPPSKHRPDLPPALERVVLGCLEKDVAKRIQSAGELRIALLPFVPQEVADNEEATQVMPSLRPRSFRPRPPVDEAPPSVPLPPASTASSASVAMPAPAANAAPRSRLSPRAMGIAIGVGAAWIAAAVILIALRKPPAVSAGESGATSASASATATVTATATATAVDQAKPIDSAQPIETAEPSATAPQTAPPSTGAAPEGEAVARPSGGSRPPGKSLDEKPPAPREGSGHGIDQVAAMGALASAAAGAKRCKKPGGPTGSARVEVTFGPSGKVTSARVGGPFDGTPVGKCILGVFNGASVPPFSGSTFSAGKTVTIK
jgi:serine/threonine-protein kinase